MQVISGKKTAQEQRRENAVLVLGIIRARDGINRKQIADLSGLSVPSITSIVDFLAELGLVESREGKGVTNKRVPFYYFKPDGYCVVGVDLGRSSATGLLCDIAGNILSRFDYEYGDEETEAVRSTVVTRIRRLISTAENEGRRVMVVGFGTPGPINVETRRTLNVKNFEHWTNFQIGEFFEERLKRPVVLEYNVDMMLFFEQTIGVGRAKENMLYFSVSKGIGCGILYKGQIFRPNSTVYHSLGHLTVDPDGPICVCGNRGCLEIYCSERKLNEAIASATHVDERRSVLQEAATKFSVAARNVITLLGIENVILGGSVMSTYPEFFQLVREKLMDQHFISGNISLAVLKASDFEISVALGVSMSLAERILLHLNLSSGPDSPILTFLDL